MTHNCIAKRHGKKRKEEQGVKKQTSSHVCSTNKLKVHMRGEKLLRGKDSENCLPPKIEFIVQCSAKAVTWMRFDEVSDIIHAITVSDPYSIRLLSIMLSHFL